ncbi:hypothetical protein IQ249_14850 [Lusitaniella coriacea LEGE 07157]|uniref:Lipoprotein n=1 Tax=Lusitaniella coriacea LEGE 07157 TaxID=945747 RepID=A0A8J7DXT4_9CYAN|nr:hypothetical protein [Lusitaniella coriacea]MBE9117177.1 hypothetical protein [Lusitaniella coriacea LEGE 07157]
MKTAKIPELFLTVVLIAVSGALAACGQRTQLEACKFVEIEDAEVEAEWGDVDIERGEVEMVCGDKIVDVTWGEFKRQLKVDPGQYKQNLEAFKQQVSCTIDEKSRKKEIFCQSASNGGDFVNLPFSYDD